MGVYIHRCVETESNASASLARVFVFLGLTGALGNAYLRARKRRSSRTLRRDVCAHQQQDEPWCIGLRTSTLCDSALSSSCRVPGVSVKLVRALHSPLLDIYLMKRK